MELPKIPEDEASRMESLNKLNLLESPIQENFERITRITQALFNMPIVSFTLVDANRQWFKSIQGLDVCETSRHVSFCAHVINQDDLFVINDALLDPRFADNPLVTGEPKIRFYAGFPVRAPDGAKIGTLCLIDMKPRNFTDKELSQLKDMAKMVEVEINTTNKTLTIQEQLNSELVQAKRQAMVDGLTRLWNRSGIEELMKKQFTAAQDNQEQFGVALIDIDNFKSINDTYGHSAGDSVLRAVAKRLLEGYRSTDSVGRWGGEEFLVVMNSPKSNNFFDAAERARNVISAKPIIFENLEITITITTGLSSFNWDEPCEIYSLITDADKALYHGKNEGKNVVKVSLHVKDLNQNTPPQK
jgi:diguanylate cyclase (GGDEF)-like protein